MMIKITEIQSISAKKAKVFLEERPSLVLYKGELNKLHWQEGDGISEEAYDSVRRDTVEKRAKLYAMRLLQDQDRTEKEMTDKLIRAGYDPAIAAVALDYVKAYGYVDDERYATRYIERNRRLKSHRQIRQDLMRRGIDAQRITDLLQEQAQSSDEYDAVVRLLKKRRYQPAPADDAFEEEAYRKEAAREREKQLRYLASKGFSYAAVRYVMDHWDEWQDQP